MEKTLLDCVRGAGRIVLEYFGRELNVRMKGEQSSVVTDADVAAEGWIVERIRSRFPTHSILAEETGHARQAGSEYTWIIDPLDGTSNFAAGLPWFGVQVAVLREDAPILAAMFLPVTQTLYWSAKGAGVKRDGVGVRVSAAEDIKDTLWAFGLDATSSSVERRQQAEWFTRVANGVRNLRATNCLLDFCYTIDGRLGGMVNLNTKIWDIAPAALMLAEAGGVLSDLRGAPIEFRLEAEPFDRSYAVMGAGRELHRQAMGLLK